MPLGPTEAGSSWESIRTGADPILLGRESECDRLSTLLSEAAAGDGGGLVLYGEPGVGKSALLRYVQESADGFHVVSASGVESEVVLPFAALGDVLEPFRDRIEVLPTPQAAALRGALRLTNEQVEDRLAVHAAVRALLREVAESKPLAVLIDDTHCIDASSRESLLFCARRLRGARVAVVFAVRESELDCLNGGLPTLAVAGLNAEESLQLARRLAPNIDPGVSQALHRGTRGNPLAITEIVAGLTPSQLTGRAAMAEPLPVGRRLEEVFGAHVRSLSENTQLALLVAAATGSGSLDAIRSALLLLGLGPDELESAHTANLIEVTEGRVMWRHPLIRSVTYHGASGSARRAAHSALAEVAGEARLDDHRAWHLAAAADAPDEEVAVLLDEVAERARRRGALAVAIRALVAAARLTPSDEPRAARLLEAAARAVALGDSDHALALTDEALELTEQPVVRAHGERLRARVEMLRGVPAVAHHRLVAGAEAIQSAEPGLATEMLSEAIVANMADGNVDEYLATARRALEVSKRAAPGADSLPGLLLALGLVATGEGAEAIALFDLHRHVAERPELWAAAPEIVGMTALGHIWIERYGEAQRLLALVTAAARSSGALRALAFPLAVEADLHLRMGRWPAAYAAATEAVELAEACAEGALLSNNLVYLARVNAWLGHEQSARRNASRGLEIAEALNLRAVAPYGLHALGMLELSLGEVENAIAHLEAAPGQYGSFWGEPGHSLWEGDLVECYLRAHQHSLADAALTQYERHVQRTGRCHGQAVLARLHGLRAAESEFETHFEEAIRWNERAGMPFETARTRLYYGERLRRARRRVDAREQLAQAAYTFSALGARIWSERARAEEVAAGARVSRPRASATHSGLTAAEARVADAILSGATYREAAERLYLSPRTVEYHLRRIYRKLGVRSRGELAAVLSSQG